MDTSDDFPLYRQMHKAGMMNDVEYEIARQMERKKRVAVLAMIPLAEGKPAVHVNGRDGSMFVCRRVSDLRLDLEDCTFYGMCDWVDPPEARPGELSDGEAISSIRTTWNSGQAGGTTAISTGTWCMTRC